MTLISAIGAAVCAGPDGVTTDPTTRTTNDSKLIITPAVDTAGVGESLLFRVAGDTQHVVRWTFSDTTIARITDQNGGWVSLQTLREGSTTLTATRDGESGRASLVVLDSYSPDTAVAAVRFGWYPMDPVSVGDSVHYGVNAHDADGSVLMRPVTWTISDSTIAQTRPTEYSNIVWLRAVRNGVVTLTATVEGKSDCARLIVGDSIPADAPRCPTRPIAHFAFAHPNAIAYLGAFLGTGIWIEDAEGFLLRDRTVTWSVGDTTILQLLTPSSASAPGLAQASLKALRTGITTLTGTCEGWTAVQTIRVIPQP